MSQINSDITITLDGGDYLLRSNLKAATAISRQFGGLNNAFTALGRGDLDAFTFIIRSGLAKESLQTLKEEKVDVAEAVWRTGMDNLAEPAARYVNMLRNGGRDPDGLIPDDEDEDAGNDSLHV